MFDRAGRTVQAGQDREERDETEKARHIEDRGAVSGADRIGEAPEVGCRHPATDALGQHPRIVVERSSGRIVDRESPNQCRREKKHSPVKYRQRDVAVPRCVGQQILRLVDLGE